jgi:hypothetical protein
MASSGAHKNALKLRSMKTASVRRISPRVYATTAEIQNLPVAVAASAFTLTFEKFHRGDAESAECRGVFFASFASLR